jgi:Fur family transcriptional regulator, zinc uptake regulator
MAQNCSHTAPSPRSTRSVAHSLAEVERRLRGKGLRWTEPRRRVLELLLIAGGPVKAYELMAAYDGRVGPAKPPTVYRALEFLEQAGLVHRIASLNAFVACGVDEQPHRAAFLICECCGTVAEFDPQGNSGGDAAVAVGFAVNSMVLEVRGTCAPCQA